MRVLFVGGGTLGSVTPLLAIAEKLHDPSPSPHRMGRGGAGGGEVEWHDRVDVTSPSLTLPPPLEAGREGINELKKKPEVFFWGTRRGPERALVEAAGIPFRVIPAGKLRRYWDIRNLLDLVIVKWAFWVAFVRLIRWRPNVVMGAGSFVQVPVMWAAWVLRIPIVIHQLDVRASLANRLVAPFATRITVTFPESAKAFRHAEVVGAPVRRAILAAQDLDPREAKRHFGFTGDRPVLLVLGGGTGALALNELIAAAFYVLTTQADILHITGSRKVSIRDYALDAMERYRSFELLTDDLPFAYAAADLVVSRAGMGTIAELAALRKSMVLVPMPGTHQENNAAALVERRAAIALNQRKLTSSKLDRQVFALLRDVRHRAALSRAAAALFPSDAATRIADITARVTLERRRRSATSPSCRTHPPESPRQESNLRPSP